MADLAAALKCEVLIVAKNELGTLNHTFLTLEALRNRRVRHIKVVLMEQSNPDPSSKTNLSTIRKIAENIGVYSLSHFKRRGSFGAWISAHHKKNKKTLARIMHPDTFITVVLTAAKAAKAAKRKTERLKD